MSRAPSPTRTLQALAKAGIAARAIFADGTVIETLTSADSPLPMPAQVAREKAAADKAVQDAIREGI